MNPIQSKRRNLDLQVRPSLGVEQDTELDLEAHSQPLDDEDLREVAAYGKTGTCSSFH